MPMASPAGSIVVRRNRADKILKIPSGFSILRVVVGFTKASKWQEIELEILCAITLSEDYRWSTFHPVVAQTPRACEGCRGSRGEGGVAVTSRWQLAGSLEGSSRDKAEDLQGSPTPCDCRAHSVYMVYEQRQCLRTDDVSLLSQHQPSDSHKTMRKSH